MKTSLFMMKVYTCLALHPYDALVDLVKEKNWDKLSIGLEMDTHYLRPTAMKKLKVVYPMQNWLTVKD